MWLRSCIGIEILGGYSGTATKTRVDLETPGKITTNLRQFGKRALLIGIGILGGSVAATKTRVDLVTPGKITTNLRQFDKRALSSVYIQFLVLLFLHRFCV